MKNLELKSYYNKNSINSNLIKFDKTLYQKDTYFKTSTGDRLKLREETSSNLCLKTVTSNVIRFIKKPL